MSSKSHFVVCQHLENVSRDALEKYQFIIRDFVRRRQGIYALYRRDKLYYVGLASNLRSRLTMHLRDRHGQSWDRFSVYLCVSDAHLRELEALVLRIVQQPKGNQQMGKLPRSEDLRRKLGAEIRKYQREEFKDLIGRKLGPKKELAQEAVAEIPGRRPVLAAYVQKPLKLRVRFKGKLLQAQVRRDGRIRFKGALYDSPSVAGAAACGRGLDTAGRAEAIRGIGCGNI
jgi:hypothetical protein